MSVISLFWRLARRYREHCGSVLDMGAGDCRFATGGGFDRYTGVEIDGKRVAAAKPPVNGRIIRECAFRHAQGGYDACVGNPPYARHHDIESGWKERTLGRLERELGVSLNRNTNLFIYFLCLGLLKTHDDGLLALVIPYEWVSRPSARAVREYIQANRWNVAVYRFQMAIFPEVLTTASVSIVDKARRDGSWKYYDITPSYRVISRQGAAGSEEGVLPYAARGKVWGLRGLSPGTQKIFTLTEGERIRTGLGQRDVVPCVTTLKDVPRSLRNLSKAAFKKYFVMAGKKCWLIRSDKDKRSAALNAYLDAVPLSDRQTYTCRNQTPWFKYHPHPVPRLLFSSGFTTFGPKVLLNCIGARTVGSVWGIHGQEISSLRRLQNYLLTIDFEKQVVAHAKTLKKVEVKQLNSVLNNYAEQEQNGAYRAARY
jgi:hypothetical protein